MSTDPQQLTVFDHALLTDKLKCNHHDTQRRPLTERWVWCTYCGALLDKESPLVPRTAPTKPCHKWTTPQLLGELRQGQDDREIRGLVPLGTYCVRKRQELKLSQDALERRVQINHELMRKLEKRIKHHPTGKIPYPWRLGMDSLRRLLIVLELKPEWVVFRNGEYWVREECLPPRR